MTLAPSKDSDQPGLNRYLRAQCFFMRTANTLIRLDGSQLIRVFAGCTVILLVLSCGSSNADGTCIKAFCFIFVIFTAFIFQTLQSNEFMQLLNHRKF